MAGLHFYCGDWLGDDKSANPIEEVINSVADHVTPEEEDQWTTNFIEKLDEQSKEEVIEMSLSMLESAKVPLQLYRDFLIQKLNLPGPSFTLDDLGGFPRSLREEEEHLLCVMDMLTGLEKCREYGKPLCIHFC